MDINLVCLGIGNGTSYVLRGRPSSSFVITIENKPFLLIDCGAGIGLSYQKYFGDQAPENIYISHNHLDHTGDLPIFLINFFKTQGKRINVFGHNDVLKIVREHRMHEFCSTGIDIDEIANWQTNDSKEIQINKEVKLKLFKSQHSYLCYGFNLLVDDKVVMGFSGDSGYNNKIYDFISKAPIILVDGREVGSYEHASFSDILHHASKFPNQLFYIFHHEKTDITLTSDNVKFLSQGYKKRLM